ncbi:MAG TPA: hypothetical protein VN133_07880 [Humibacter sp.]|nr:hypothetical protein [Humibacter sp.]
MPFDAFIAGLVAVAVRGPVFFFVSFAVIGLLVVVGAVTSLRWLVALERRYLGAVFARTARRRVAPVRRNVLVRHPAPSARPVGSGGLADFLDGPRARPYNPEPGPRDW